MRRSLLLSLCLLFTSLLAILFCRAQSGFAYQSTLGQVDEAGFYKIVLRPAILSKCGKALHDIRIFDAKGMQVPYILRSDARNFSEINFVELPMLSSEVDTLNQTEVVVQNNLNEIITELMLVIRNTDADRTVTVSGSDDRKRWFVIKEGITLVDFFYNGNDRFLQPLRFPASSYKFFKVLVNGKGLLPVNIVKAGVYKDSFYNQKFIAVPIAAIRQKDSSDKSSYVSLIFTDRYLIDKIDLIIEGPKYYRREAQIDGGAFSPKASVTLRPDITTFGFATIKTKLIKLAISNGDNPPLKIASAKAYQHNRYLLAWLEPSDKYQLLFGDSAAYAPNYDLESFKDSIESNFKEIATGTITKNALYATGSNQPDDKRKSVMLWVVIGAVLALLLAVTLKMTKEIKQ